MKKRFLLGATLMVLTLVLVAAAMAWQAPGSAIAEAPPNALADTRGEPRAQAPATTHCSTNFCLDWQVLSGGLGEMASSSFRLRSTLGQTMAGVFSGSSYTLRAGYWTSADSGDKAYLPLLLRP